jgi:hypothetical protein
MSVEFALLERLEARVVELERQVALLTRWRELREGLDTLTAEELKQFTAERQAAVERMRAGGRRTPGKIT